MLSLYFGPDTFRAQQQINATIKQQTTHKIDQIDGTIINPETLSNTLKPLQLFAEKKLLIIKNLLANKQNKVHEIVKNAFKKPDSDTDIIFWEKNTLDKRSYLYKFFTKNKKNIFEFQPLKKPQLISWVQNYCRQNNIQIDHQALLLLIDKTPDSYQLTNEIKKLKNFTNNNITTTAIDILTPPNHQEIIFDLTDQIGNRKKLSAYNTALNLIKKGEDQLKILATLTTHFQNILIIKDLTALGFTLNQIKEQSKIHPYVIPKIIKQANNFSLSEIIKIHHRLTQADIELKTGKNNFSNIIFQLIFR